VALWRVKALLDEYSQAEEYLFLHSYFSAWKYRQFARSLAKTARKLGVRRKRVTSAQAKLIYKA
jgi:hypothetical protein